MSDLHNISGVLQRPTQAVILAGGRGERMRPLTDLRPKPMIEVGGKPFLEHQITMLREHGFKRVLLLLGYLPDVVRDYFGDGRKWGMEIDYSVTAVEDKTGRRLKLAENKIEDLFFLLYCDNYWPMPWEKMWRRFLEANTPMMVTVYSNKDNYTKSVLRVDDGGFVAAYDKTRKTPDLQGTEISYAIMQKELLSRLPGENIGLEETLFPLLIRERQLAAFVTHHRYYSVGDTFRLPITEAFLARSPAIILDRDGVLNEKPPRANYVRNWGEFKWMPGAKESLRLLKEAGYRVIVVSNQAGIARGAMSEGDLFDIHRRMVKEAELAGGRIDAIYYCPHGWDEGCECRKPKPGMLFQAQHDFNLDLSRTFFIGDDERDGQAAEAADCLSALVSNEKTLLNVLAELSLTRNKSAGS
ncbi:MAG TPA: HAD-IIIA family hydrolase [Verrucomicrobiae bacterium]|jgi:D-glycero-D-manno-heptose 1,7-bisphosphate phosphatase|nr:HAD-IIIA family hydrolase [Verrucomicrobiae bacterium]